ncbi:MAG TPA: hypothetical protein VNN21_05215 [Dehalococcoidia bacterium]|nr:hypothetical protein [Dehalococcoidia bacterium]
MSEITLQLRQEDAKLVFLAIAYHLGRPGSELDPTTKQPVEHGLAEVAQALQPQLRLAVATIGLRHAQLKRLLSGMLGSITELKAYPMLGLRADGSGRRSTVPGFDGSLQHLFPEVVDDAEAALDVAERMLNLKRRLDQETAGAFEEEEERAQPSSRRKSWWPFRRAT